MESVRALLLALRRLGTGDSGLARVRRIAAVPFGGWKTLNSFLVTHSTLQSRFGSAIGLPDTVPRSLFESYERSSRRSAATARNRRESPSRHRP
jgi:hypothetical protein